MTGRSAVADHVRVKRVYDAPARGDGRRILVDRLWPRGVSRAKARVDDWARDLAPSTELRTWFGHDPARWAEFQKRYRAELRRSPELASLVELAQRGPITLVHAARDSDHSNAGVLRRLLRERLGRAGSRAPSRRELSRSSRHARPGRPGTGVPRPPRGAG